MLNHKVDKGDIYQRQQGECCVLLGPLVRTSLRMMLRAADTLIVWTEPASGQDIALSFQDAEGCEDIWTFITEVQKHLSLMTGQSRVRRCREALMGTEAESRPMVDSSSPVAPAGALSVGVENGEARATWQPPTLANIKWVLTRCCG